RQRMQGRYRYGARRRNRQKRFDRGFEIGDARFRQPVGERERLAPGLMSNHAHEIEDVQKVPVHVEIAEVALAEEVDKWRFGSGGRSVVHFGDGIVTAFRVQEIVENGRTARRLKLSFERQRWGASIDAPRRR